MLRFVFAVLAFLSGSVALAHELLWTRRLIDLLGATESVTGRVLGLFFLGLALGGWLATRWGSPTATPRSDWPSLNFRSRFFRCRQCFCHCGLMN